MRAPRGSRGTGLASDEATTGLHEQAARWAARSAYGDLTEQAEAELRDWLAADRRNRGAYLRARAGLHVLEEAVSQGSPTLASDNDNGPEPIAQPLARWAGRLAAGGVAVAVSVAAFAMLGLPLMPAKDIAVAGEIVNLKDGSVVRLGDDAQITVAMTGDARTIVLLHGEATFDVAPDPARPFVVRSGEVFAQATGTVYTVGRSGLAGGTVSVTEGSVLVWGREERDQAVLLHAGGKLTLDPGPPPPLMSPQTSPRAPLPAPEVAQISLDNVTIAAAAARFNRINRAQIVIGDPGIGETSIIGLFNANDPAKFARAAAEVAGAEVIVTNERIVIKKK